MTDLSHLREGEEILVRAIVERTTGSHAQIRVGDGAAIVVAHDLARPASEPETLIWCGRAWAVLGRDGGHHWLGRGGMRLSVPDGLIFEDGEQR